MDCFGQLRGWVMPFILRTEPKSKPFGEIRIWQLLELMPDQCSLPSQVFDQERRVSDYYYDGIKRHGVLWLQFQDLQLAIAWDEVHTIEPVEEHALFAQVRLYFGCPLRRSR
ncbi:hypothetical protein B5E41_10510 [Rhizobium esperanzae]|uniref:Uncharacterized protein n=1 Tax=Rhizobium esperanzae TaxID=1967781 RepID=A0A246DZ82_9HYPH|nr:hypothetical protein B5E41_10510 [Rhizobium esperanzae]